MEAQSWGEGQPFSIDVKGGEVADKGRITNIRKVADWGSIRID
jgi:hypothetical protein